MSVLRRLLVAFATVVATSTARAQVGGERLFYYVDREDSYRSLVAHIDQITVLGPQVYTVDSVGLVYGSLDRRVLELTKAHHVKVMPLVVNEGFNQAALHRLLADTAARSRAISSFVELCRRNGYWGIQFDVENVALLDRDRFTAWFTDAARALHAGGLHDQRGDRPSDGRPPGSHRLSPVSRGQLADVRPRRVRASGRLPVGDELRPTHSADATRPGGGHAVGAVRGRLLSALRAGGKALARDSTVWRLLVRSPRPESRSRANDRELGELDVGLRSRRA